VIHALTIQCFSTSFLTLQNNVFLNNQQIFVWEQISLENCGVKVTKRELGNLKLSWFPIKKNLSVPFDGPWVNRHETVPPLSPYNVCETLFFSKYLRPSEMEAQFHLKQIR
jgi:hypothetical protein